MQRNTRVGLIVGAVILLIIIIIVAVAAVVAVADLSHHGFEKGGMYSTAYNITDEQEYKNRIGYRSRYIAHNYNNSSSNS